MTTDQLSSSSYITITRDPNNPDKDYQLPLDVAEVLYQSGQLEKIKQGRMTRYMTPFIDDPEIGLHQLLSGDN